MRPNKHMHWTAAIALPFHILHHWPTASDVIVRPHYALMALDFCIGQESELPVFSFPEHMHTQLFIRTDELRRLPQLRRIADFYSDVIFEGADLGALLQELQQVLPVFASRPQMQAALQQLREVCQTAITQSRGLYGYCD